VTTRLGLTIPLAQPLAEHGDLLADLTGNAGYTDLWTAETAGTDAFTPLVHASATLTNTWFGTGIASVYARSPAALAMQSAALAEAAPGRALIGIGASARSMVEGWHDRRYERPLERVADTARFLRSALAGERVTADYGTFSIRRFALERVPEQAPPIIIAALGPGMLKVAGQLGDGVMLNWLAARDIERCLSPVLSARPATSAAPIVVARVLVCPSEHTATVRRRARDLIARYLTVPGYANYHRWLGRGDELAGLWSNWSEGNRAAAAAAIPDALIDELVLHGNPQQCAAQLGVYVRAGVDVPVVKLVALDDEIDLNQAAAALGHAFGDLA